MRELAATAWGGSRREARVATMRCRAATAWGESGGKAGADAERRQRGVGCPMARVSRAVHEGSISDMEAWRDEENAPRVGRPIGRANVDDSVVAVPHTHHIAQEVGLDLEVPH